jgi:hypothetical protein
LTPAQSRGIILIAARECGTPDAMTAPDFFERRSTMSEITSFADFIIDWERLLTAVTNNEANLPDLGLQRISLQDILQEAKAVSTRQDASRSQLAMDSKRRREILFEGRAAASRLRAALKGALGGHNEKLVEFGLRPIRRRRSIPLVDPPLPIE